MGVGPDIQHFIPKTHAARPPSLIAADNWVITHGTPVEVTEPLALGDVTL